MLIVVSGQFVQVNDLLQINGDVLEMRLECFLEDFPECNARVNA